MEIKQKTYLCLKKARTCFTVYPLWKAVTEVALKLRHSLYLKLRMSLGLWFQASLNSCRVRSPLIARISGAVYDERPTCF
ncbi:hypothetical protein BpHYR1_021116 [Brachionus plicatilis]|uniref:Uncharacterized protein n=1 Tax=Brachionus plicatilis TaxID=10195 RepID=A0A3M7SDJ7_BRAPC|nr:hypothetical protein BpHYR1_021116 [Brachionus plicatilis]